SRKDWRRRARSAPSPCARARDGPRAARPWWAQGPPSIRPRASRRRPRAGARSRARWAGENQPWLRIRRAKFRVKPLKSALTSITDELTLCVLALRLTSKPQRPPIWAGERHEHGLRLRLRPGRTAGACD